MELWVPITIAAAFAQNVRSALQRKLTDRLSSSEAAYVRFCYALPFAVVYLAGLGALGYTIPGPNVAFFGYAAVGGIGQILGTIALIASFGYRNFAVGTAFSKTETVQTALFGFLLLGESVAPLAGLGIGVCLAGVVVLSSPDGLRSFAKLGVGPGGWLGIAAGAGFGISAVCYRAACLSLPEGEAAVRASLTLVAATAIQTLAMGGYFAWRERGALSRVARSWRTSAWVGLFGMMASSAWFTAMTLERAAYVRAVGQVELLFTFVATVLFFREKVRVSEVMGSVIIVLGLVLVLAG